MKCPTCPASTLVITERSNVEIDYCPQCRGVWLDRGELDKLVQLSTDRDDAAARRDAGFHDSGGYVRRPKHRKSWLGDIFD
jgi:Zn-finger nucleic acid-binding protein